MAKRLTMYILIAMVVGIILGITLNKTVADPATLKEITGYISILTEIFLRLIKMIIAPLVFATLVVGISHMGDTAALGRVGARAIGWFLGASLLSLTLGLVMVNLLQPASARTSSCRPRARARGCRRAISRSSSSSPISCPRASSRRWRPTRYCRSWSSRSSPASR